jgi:hypothetical protein
VRSQTDGVQLRAFADCGLDECDPVWTGNAIGESDAQWTEAVVAGDLVYVGSSEHWESTSSMLQVFSANGCGQATCDPILSLPVDGLVKDIIVANGKVFVSTTTGVYAFGLPPS